PDIARALAITALTVSESSTTRMLYAMAQSSFSWPDIFKVVLPVSMFRYMVRAWEPPTSSPETRILFFQSTLRSTVWLRSPMLNTPLSSMILDPPATLAIRFFFSTPMSNRVWMKSMTPVSTNMKGFFSALAASILESGSMLCIMPPVRVVGSYSVRPTQEPRANVTRTSSGSLDTRMSDMPTTTFISPPSDTPKDLRI